MYICSHVFVSVCVYICVCACVCECLNMYMLMWVHVHVFVCVYVCMYAHGVCVYVCICVCLCVCVCVHSLSTLGNVACLPLSVFFSISPFEVGSLHKLWAHWLASLESSGNPPFSFLTSVLWLMMFMPDSYMGTDDRYKVSFHCTLSSLTDWLTDQRALGSFCLCPTSM